MAYGSEPLPKISTKAHEADQSNSSANFISTYTAKSHKHMVYVLCILNSNIDNEGADEPTSLKKAIAQYDRPE